MNLPPDVWLQQLDQSMVILYMEMEKGWQKITCGVLLCWVAKGIQKKKKIPFWPRKGVKQTDTIAQKEDESEIHTFGSMA